MNNNTIGTDVKVKPNPPYEMVTARVEIDNAAYIPSYALASLDSAKPLVYTYASTDTCVDYASIIFSIIGVSAGTNGRTFEYSFVK